MLEWLKRHAWKACNRPKRFRGSNPRLSARISDGVQSVKGESPSLRKDLDFCCKNRNFVVSFRARNDRSTSDLPPTYLRLTSDLPPTYLRLIGSEYGRTIVGREAKEIRRNVSALVTSLPIWQKYRLFRGMGRKDERFMQKNVSKTQKTQKMFGHII